MNGKTAKILLFSVVFAFLLLGCEDAWHPEEYHPESSGPIVPDGISYNISFNANGGSGTPPSPKSAKSGESITIPNSGSLSRTNYTFGGWNTSVTGTGTNYPTGISFTVPTQDVTLYAKWEPVSSSGGAVSVISVYLNESSLSLDVGKTATLRASINPSNATNKNVSWSTSNSSVATVSDGTVTAKSAGTATITVTADGNKTATCAVTVLGPVISVTSVSLNKTSLSLMVGKTETLTAAISPGNASNKKVSWITSNSYVATVSDGTVTAKSIGTATITVTTADGNKTATCAVNVTRFLASAVNVTAKAYSSTSIKIEWSKEPNVSDGGYYEIYMSLSASGPYEKIREDFNNWSPISYISDLTPNTTYYFKVSLLVDDPEKNYWTPLSSYASAKTPIIPGKPSNISATATSSSSIAVSWSPVYGADHYYIACYYDGWKTVDKIITKSTSCSFTSLFPGIEYEVFIRPYNECEEGGDPSSVFVYTPR